MGSIFFVKIYGKLDVFMDEIFRFLNLISILQLTQEEEFIPVLMNMIKNKLLGNYDTKISMRLSGKILKPIVSFFQSAFDKDKLSYSQR